jgi:hypothetical protein
MVKNILVITFFMNVKISCLIIIQEVFSLNHVVVSIIEYFLFYSKVENISRKNFYFSNIDYIHKLDEIRCGLHTRTFDRLVRHKMIEQSDVSNQI